MVLRDGTCVHRGLHVGAMVLVEEGGVVWCANVRKWDGVVEVSVVVPATCACVHMRVRSAVQ